MPKQTKLENVVIIAMYCHWRPPDTTVFSIQHLVGHRIWAADESNAVSFRVAVGRHVNADKRCAMDWDGTK